MGSYLFTTLCFPPLCLPSFWRCWSDASRYQQSSYSPKLIPVGLVGAEKHWKGTGQLPHCACASAQCSSCKDSLTLPEQEARGCSCPREPWEKLLLLSEGNGPSYGTTQQGYQMCRTSSPCAEKVSRLWMVLFCFAVKTLFSWNLLLLCAIQRFAIPLGFGFICVYPKHYTCRKSTNIASLCIKSWFYLARKRDVFHCKLGIETMRKDLELNHRIYSLNSSSRNLG